MICRAATLLRRRAGHEQLSAGGAREIAERPFGLLALRSLLAIHIRDDGHHVDRHVDAAGDAGHLLRLQLARGVETVGEHDDRPAPGVAGTAVHDAARGLRDRVVERSLAVGRDAGERALDRAGVGGERLQRLQVHVEAEHRRFVRVHREAQRAQHVARGRARVFETRRQPHAAADVEQQRNAHRRVVVGTEIDEIPSHAPLFDDEVVLAEIPREPALAIPHDRGDRNEVDRGAERGLDD